MNRRMTVGTRNGRILRMMIRDRSIDGRGVKGLRGRVAGGVPVVDLRMNMGHRSQIVRARVDGRGRVSRFGCHLRILGVKALGIGKLYVGARDW